MQLDGPATRALNEWPGSKRKILTKISQAYKIDGAFNFHDASSNASKYLIEAFPRIEWKFIEDNEALERITTGFEIKEALSSFQSCSISYSSDDINLRTDEQQKKVIPEPEYETQDSSLLSGNIGTVNSKILRRRRLVRCMRFTDLITNVEKPESLEEKIYETDVIDFRQHKRTRKI